MWRAIRTYVLGLGALTVLAAPCMATDDVTGVSGTVSMSPAHPGPQHAGEPDASPYPNAIVQLRDALGSVVAEATTNAQGQFTVAVPAGTYAIRVDTRSTALPRCETVEATVRSDQVAHVAILCDSGMR
ncbi:carboxypeptidase-like regulatory domain-containing protein [Dyella soli]